jgi:diaminopimelate decarboxylase
MLYSNLAVSAEGHLTIDGADTVELAEKYGTPLYLMDEDRIRENMRVYTNAMKAYMPEGSFPLLASKACCFKDLFRIAEEEGMGADLVSAGEICTAAAAKFPMERTCFHGNNKTDADIELALDAGVGYFAVDNPEELEALERAAARRGITQKILLRITPGIDPHTHKKINTGVLDSKFGEALPTGQALAFFDQAAAMPHLSVEGMHSHIGSQIFSYQPLADAAEIMLEFLCTLRDTRGYKAKILNLGGGFGVRYTQEDPVMDYRENIRLLGSEICRLCDRFALRQPRILLEPGRSIVGDAGITVYTVGSVKTIPGVKNYISIDGGMTDNPRYTLYGAAYTVLLANRADEKADFPASVVGRCCESGDIIQENVSLPKPARGDYLAVLTTGAYNYSMASNYNRIPRPPVVMLRGGEDRVAVRRETFADLLKCDQ